MGEGGLLVRVAFRLGQAVGDLRERWHPTPRPPKGTRPVVRLHYDGIIYDLSEDLERVNDDDQGRAVWRVHGPKHLRMIEQACLEIDRPLPENTALDICFIGDPEQGANFRRLDEH